MSDRAFKLRYTGNKPIVSCRGVDCSLGKKDKYLYIEPAAQMLDFLGKLKKDTKIMINPNKPIDEEEVLKILYKYRPDFDIFYNTRISAYKKKIEDEILNVDNHKRLGEIEKEVLKNNLKFMKDYRVQRATNKLVYEELVNACVDIIRQKGIVEIIMPFSLPFVHVATSFESSLALLSHAAVAKVEIILHNQERYTRLSVKGFGNV